MIRSPQLNDSGSLSLLSSADFSATAAMRFVFTLQYLLSIKWLLNTAEHLAANEPDFPARNSRLKLNWNDLGRHKQLPMCRCYVNVEYNDV